MERPIAKKAELPEVLSEPEQTMPNSMQRPMKFPTVAIAIPVVALGALIAWGAVPRIVQTRALQDHERATIGEAPSVAVAIAEPSPSTEEFKLPGSTIAIQDAPIYARVDGYLRNRFVDIGDRVHKGQIIADIDTPELDMQVQAAANAAEQARANLENAQESLHKAEADEKTAAANVRKAKTDLQYASVEIKRYKMLAEQGAVSLESRDNWVQTYNGDLASLDASQNAEHSAQAAVKSARAAIRVAEAAMHAAQSQHEQYEATRSFQKVTALFDGVVTKRNVDAGALITSGSNTSNNILFEIAKTDVLRIYVDVPEQYLSNVHVGETARLTFQEFPGKDFSGKVSNIAGGLDPTSKTLQVEILIDNRDHKLMPGMYAQVTFRAPSTFRLPIIPASCVQSRASGMFAYVVDSHNRVHVSRIEIARDLGGQVEINRGLNIDDRVIISPSDEINDGMLVRPLVEKADGKAAGV